MSTGTIEPMAAELNIIDLRTVDPADLDRLWQQEATQWRERLFWDVPTNSMSILRALKSGSVQGRALTAGTELIGYSCYYIVTGNRGVISALVLAPPWRHARVGNVLIQAIVADMHQSGVRRIECPSVSFDVSWQPDVFERIGFQAYWREFLRVELPHSSELEKLVEPPGTLQPGTLQIEPWPNPSRAADIGEAALVMQAAYDGGVDAAISELYRSLSGCRTVLQNLMRQSLGGRFVAEASGRVRQDGQLLGFSLITEISHRHAHLAQIVVLPQFQGKGMGRLLLEYSRNRLQHLAFDTLSLIVSQTNHRAAVLYQDVGFKSVLSYPAFTWDQ